jgi:hypothetical protein
LGDVGLALAIAFIVTIAAATIVMVLLNRRKHTKEPSEQDAQSVSAIPAAGLESARSVDTSTDSHPSRSGDESATELPTTTDSTPGLAGSFVSGLVLVGLICGALFLVESAVTPLEVKLARERAEWFSGLPSGIQDAIRRSSGYGRYDDTPSSWAPIASMVLVPYYILSFGFYMLVEHQKRNTVRWMAACILFTPIIAFVAALLSWPDSVQT